MKRLIALAFLVLSGGTVHGQSYSCPIGKRAACLDYGDKVVDQSAQCFNSYTCDFHGFACKSDLNKVVAGYEEIFEKHNKLVRDYNSLRSCLMIAATLEDAQLC